MDYPAIKAEITLPAYAAMTDAQIAAALMAKTVPGPSARLIIPAYRLFNAIDQTEYNSAALASMRPRVAELLAMGEVDASSGTPTRILLTTVFSVANAPISRAAIIALANSIETTALPFARSPGETINTGDIARARLS